MVVSAPSTASSYRCLDISSPDSSKLPVHLVSPHRESTDKLPNENESDDQKAKDLLFGGELYVKLLGYAGREGVAQCRDDRCWRMAMDALPDAELRALELPVVPSPKTDLDLFLLRSLLTEPVISKRTGKTCGWKLNDLATMILASSPLTSDQMLQSLIYPGCDEKVMSYILVDGNKHLSVSLLQKMIISGCPPKLFERIVAQQNATNEILSAILLRLPQSRSSQKTLDIGKVLYAIATHKNTNQMDLQYLAAHVSVEARKGVAQNVNAERFGLLQNLSKDGKKEVREACALNASASKEMLVELSRDSSLSVRRAVARNERADKTLLKMLASFNTDKTLLWHIQSNKNCSNVDEILSINNKNHRSTLACCSNDSGLLRTLLGMDGGTYDNEVASNDAAPVDTLQVLVNSRDQDIRDTVARNESITASLVEELMQDEGCKIALAGNEATPAHILELLSVHDDADVQEAVACNTQTPPEVLERMATMDAQSDEVLEAIFCVRYNDIPLTFLERACSDALTNEEGIPLDFLAYAVLNHKSVSKVSLEILSALINTSETTNRLRLLENSRLPVGDIMRLYHDPELNKNLVNARIRKNALLQVAVDKLFRLYFNSKDGVGGESDFSQGEQWW